MSLSNGDYGVIVAQEPVEFPDSERNRIVAQNNKMKELKEEVYKTVYLIRHGQSKGNVSPVYQGPESPLSETGKRQAKIMADRMAKIPFDAIISSPFSRAKETAEIIAKATGKDVELSDLFMERLKPSSVNNKSFEDTGASSVYQKSFQNFYNSNPRIEGEENMEDLVKRAGKALDFLLNHQEENLTVVSHGFFLKAIVARVLLKGALSPESFKSFDHGANMENTGITVIRYSKRFDDAQWRLWVYNDHAHLG